MTRNTLRITDDLAVSLHYDLRLDDGELVDSSAGREPLQFLQGHGEIIPGLEQALYGMAVGDEKDVLVAPSEGYGEIEPDATETVPRDAFPADMELEPGTGLHMRDSDTDEVFEAFVAEVGPDTVLLDFNHPLAGENLHFHVQVAALRKATHEELEHGHVHDSEHPH